MTTNLAGVLPQALAVQDAVDRLVVANEADWGPGGAGLPMPDGVLAMGALDGAEGAWPDVAPDDVALLQYTGGTTGAPRAAQLTHANLTSTVEIYNAWNSAHGRKLGPGDRMLCVLPLFHIYALTAVMLRAISCGVELVLHPRFQLEAVLEAIEVGRVSYFSGVPTMWIAIVNAPGIETRGPFEPAVRQ